MEQHVHPDADWGNELSTSLLSVAQAWMIAAIATLIILRPARQEHRLGQTVLAVRRRTIQGSGKRQGLGMARR